MGRSKLDGREEEIKGLLELNVSKASFALDKSSSTSLRSVQFCSPEKSLDHYTLKKRFQKIFVNQSSFGIGPKNRQRIGQRDFVTQQSRPFANQAQIEITG